MKRYLVFAYGLYYPKGGMNDFIDSFESEIMAVAYLEHQLENNDDTYWVEGHVFDTQTRIIVHKIEEK